MTVRAADVQGQEDYAVPAAIGGVSVGSRNLYVSVAFGDSPPSTAQIDTANMVLGSLLVR